MGSKYHLSSLLIFSLFMQVCLLILCPLVKWANYQADHYNAIVEKYRSNLVIVEGYREYKSNRTAPFMTRITKKDVASGFFIDSSTVLTVRGVSEGTDRVLVRDIYGNVAEAKACFSHPYLDLAIIYLDSEFNVMTLDNIHRPDPGEKCLLMTIAGDSVAYQLTNIDSVDDIHLKFSLKTYYGKSGSIILSERGDLIGIFIGLLKKDSPAVSEKISVKKLDDVFTGFGYSLQSARLNYASFFRQEHKAGPRIGIKVTEKDKGVFIKEVIDSSPAQRADLRTDDQIMYVNNRFCGNITDLHEAIYQVQGNESVYEITIKRGGKQINKKIELEVSPSPSRDSLNLRGIELISVSSQIKRAFNLEGSPYLVLSVSELSVLHDILMVMDIIIIEDENHLKRLISRIEEGFSSEMHILRNGKRKSLLFER